MIILERVHGACLLLRMHGCLLAVDALGRKKAAQLIACICMTLSVTANTARVKWAARVTWHVAALTGVPRHWQQHSLGGGTLISAVFALKSLQKDMMFKPAWPRAGPTGGAGLACPAGTSSRTMDFTTLDLADI